MAAVVAPSLVDPLPVPVETAAPRKQRTMRGVRFPGFYDDCAAEYNNVASFQCHNGGKLNFSYTFKKGSKVLVNHLNAEMDHSLPDRILVDAGAAVGTKADSTQLSTSVTNGWGTMGSLTHRFNNKYTLRSDFAFTNADSINVELQRKGADCSHAAKYSMTSKGAEFAASCMQSVGRFASIGGRIRNGPEGTIVSAVARYKRMFKGPEGEKAHHGSTVTLSANTDRNVIALYTRQLDQHTHLAAELAAKGTEVSAAAAAMFTYQSFDFQAKVTPASGLVSCIVEHKLNPIVSTLFSGQYGQWSGESKFGLGFKVAF